MSDKSVIIVYQSKGDLQENCGFLLNFSSPDIFGMCADNEAKA